MRRLVVVSVMLLGIALAAVIFAISRAPAISSVTPSQAKCLAVEDARLRFPIVSGANLSGQTQTLPEDFEGQYILVIVPFTDKQQVEAGTWLPFARETAAAYSGFTYYNVPVFPNMAAPIRALIRGGMSIAITDEQLRAITITVFLEDRALFLSELNIPNTETIQVFLLNSAGEVLWRGNGIFTPAQGENSRQTLKGN